MTTHRALLNSGSVLMECPEKCGARVSSKASHCPQCGCPITATDSVPATELPPVAKPGIHPSRLGSTITAKPIPPAPVAPVDQTKEDIPKAQARLFNQTGVPDQAVPDESNLEEGTQTIASKLFGDKR